jgi:hypothetical protein
MSEEPCATPHPKRGTDGIDVHPDLEMIGSEGSEVWAKCKRCGAWVWLATDIGSKIEYVDAWDLDRDLAELAFVQHDAHAVARLLVSTGLPRGPVWGTSSALLSIFRALTPTSNDAERSAALDDASPTGAWATAANVLREIATHPHAAKTAESLTFTIDLDFPGKSFSEFFEIGSSVILFQELPSPGIVRIDTHAVTEAPCAGPIRFLARSNDAVLFAVATPEGEAIHRIDAAGQLSAFAPSRARYSITPLENGGWLFVPDDDAPVRFIEFHESNGVPRVKIPVAFGNGSRFMCPPKRVGDGWIVSGCVDVHGDEQALSLFDSSFRMIAQSENARGQRLIGVVDDQHWWCETITPPFTLERWSRRDALLTRDLALEAQSWFRANGCVVVALRSGPLIGIDDSGNELFRQEREVHGSAYFVAFHDDAILYDDRSVRVIDPKTGADRIAPMHIESPEVHVTPNGVAYVSEPTAIQILAGASKRIFLGEELQFETTCGEELLLRSDEGRCFVIAPGGRVRIFDGPDARFSVVGTRGGPYVVEPGRVRIGSFPT